MSPPFDYCLLESKVENEQPKLNTADCSLMRPFRLSTLAYHCLSCYEQQHIFGTVLSPAFCFSGHQCGQRFSEPA